LKLFGEGLKPFFFASLAAAIPLSEFSFPLSYAGIWSPEYLFLLRLRPLFTSSFFLALILFDGLRDPPGRE